MKEEIRSNIKQELFNSFETSFSITKWTEEVLNTTLYDNEIPIVDNVSNPLIPYIVVLGPRQSGKSFSVCTGALKICDMIPGYRWTIWGPKQEQATRLIGEMSDNILPKSKLADKINWNKCNSSRILFKNGSGFLALSASEKSETEGWMSAGCLLDECVTGDTLVLTGNGSLKPIKEVFENKSVHKLKTYNFEKGCFESSEIVKRHKMPLTKELVELEYEVGGKTYKLTCTVDHLVYTKNRGYVEAGSLTTDDEVFVNTCSRIS